MNRSIAGTFFAFALLCSFAMPFAAAGAAGRMAPADEYFGPLQMSVIGIRNDLRDSLARLEGADAEGARSAVAHAALVERAIRDWETKYPGDSWLPRSLAALRAVYARTGGADGERRAAGTGAWLIAHFPASAEATALRIEMGGTR